jgi:hypothetical protein
MCLVFSEFWYSMEDVLGMGGKYMFYKYRTASKVSEKVPALIVGIVTFVLKITSTVLYIAVSSWFGLFAVALPLKTIALCLVLIKCCIFAVNKSM